jgi:hypothetical protein
MEKSRTGCEEEEGRSLRMSREEGVIRRRTGVWEEWIVQRREEKEEACSSCWREGELSRKEEEGGRRREGWAGSIISLEEDGADGETVEWFPWCLTVIPIPRLCWEVWRAGGRSRGRSAATYCLAD